MNFYEALAILRHNAEWDIGGAATAGSPISIASSSKGKLNGAAPQREKP